MGSDELIERLRTRGGRPDGFGLGPICDKAADEIERLTAQLAEARESERAAIKREAQAKLDGVRAGIEASAEIVATWGQEAGGYGPCGFTRRLIAAHLRALDPEAIAKGIITAAALSDLIAGDADLIDGGK